MSEVVRVDYLPVAKKESSLVFLHVCCGLELKLRRRKIAKLSRLTMLV